MFVVLQTIPYVFGLCCGMSLLYRMLLCFVMLRGMHRWHRILLYILHYLEVFTASTLDVYDGRLLP